MGLTTALDYAILKDRTFLEDYRRNRESLLRIARRVYMSLLAQGGPPPPDQAALERLLQTALLGASIFQAILAEKYHAMPQAHPAFALCMARYILDRDWEAVSAPV